MEDRAVLSCFFFFLGHLNIPHILPMGFEAPPVSSPLNRNLNLNLITTDSKQRGGGGGGGGWRVGGGVELTFAQMPPRERL